eukprot:4430812-Karenia_brevis.AAC.1
MSVQDTHEIEEEYGKEWHVVTPKRKQGGRKWGSPVVCKEAQDSLSPPKVWDVPPFPILANKAVDQQWPDDDEKEEKEMLSTSKESLAPNWLRG